MEQYIETLPNYMVLVRCYTFNHSAYITDALNGFTMQHTNFPYVVVMVDDASNDGEQEVIKEYIGLNFEIPIFTKDTDYAQIIYTQHKTNKNCYIAIYFLKENHYSKKKKKAPYIQPWRNKCKYEALCEGDDYWIDPMKLQKQVDFLEANPEYGMVYSNFNIFFQKQKYLKRNVFTKWSLKYPSNYFSLESFILAAGFTCPPSWLWRTNLPECPIIQSVDGTFVLFAHFLRITKVHVLMDVTVNYRILEESASHSKDYNKLYVREKNILETQMKLIDYYQLSNDLKMGCLEKYYSSNLLKFIMYNKTDDIIKAKRILVKPEKIDKILFLLNNPIGILILRTLHKIYVFIRNNSRIILR